jgi:hypothetical protein
MSGDTKTRGSQGPDDSSSRTIPGQSSGRSATAGPATARRDRPLRVCFMPAGVCRRAELRMSLVRSSGRNPRIASATRVRTCWSAQADPTGLRSAEPLLRLVLHGHSLSVTDIDCTSVGGSEFAQQVTPARRSDKARKFIGDISDVKPDELDNPPKRLTMTRRFPLTGRRREAWRVAGWVDETGRIAV